jgi:hypothetical protein
VQVTEVLENVTQVVAPVLGETMARSAAKAHCERLGVSGEMTPEQVAALVDKMGMGLNVFVGREKAQSIVEELRRRFERVLRVAS